MLALVDAGSELAGAATAAAASLLGGAPELMGGAVGSVLLVRALKHVGREVGRRVLGPRQEARIGAALAFASEEIRARLESGEQVRADWFDTDSEQQTAAELLEGVLLTAADAYEERKVKYLGRLYGSLAFEPAIDRAYANYLIRLSRRVTYRELAVTAVFASDECHRVLAGLDTARQAREARVSDPGAAELNEIGQLGLLGFRQSDGRVSPPPGTWGEDFGDGWSHTLEGLVPTSVGADLYRLMRLDDLPHDDLAGVLTELGGDPSGLL